MRKLIAVLAVGAWLAPVPSFAAGGEPVATASMYEVNEALRFLKKGRPRPTNPEDAARRLAHASLLGRDLVPLRNHSIFKAERFIQANAISNVDLRTGRGPVIGHLKVLKDIDPTRESLDTLVVESDAGIRGELDLSTAQTQGFASLSGRWSSLRPKKSGALQGVFVIPIEVADDQYAYPDIGLDGPGTLCGSASGFCPLEEHEFALGIPLTKLLVTFFD